MSPSSSNYFADEGYGSDNEIDELPEIRALPPGGETEDLGYHSGGEEFHVPEQINLP